MREVIKSSNQAEPSLSREAIENIIRGQIIYDGLELAELNIQKVDITLDVALFNDAGLALDSVDALEVIAGVQRAFGIQMPDISRAFLDVHCSTLRQLTALVESSLAARARLYASGA